MELSIFSLEKNTFKMFSDREGWLWRYLFCFFFFLLDISSILPLHNLNFMGNQFIGKVCRTEKQSMYVNERKYIGIPCLVLVIWLFFHGFMTLQNCLSLILCQCFQSERCNYNAWTIRTYIAVCLNFILRIYQLVFMLSGRMKNNIMHNYADSCVCFLFCSPSLGFLRDLCEVLLYILLPPGDFQNKIMRYFVRVNSHPNSLL